MKILLPAFFLLIAVTPSFATLTDAEKRTTAYDVSTMPGIFERQWDYYRTNFEIELENTSDLALIAELEALGYKTSGNTAVTLPDTWIAFRDATTPTVSSKLHQFYVSYRAGIVALYVQSNPNIPINSGLVFLMFAGILFGVYLLKRDKINRLILSRNR